jgi:hypothetical protein
MKRARFFGSMIRYGAVAAAVLAIAGCGGGGGGGGPESAATIDVTATNKDTVARAAVVALRGGAELSFASGGVAGGPAVVAKGTRDAMAAVLRADNVLSSRDAPQGLVDAGDLAADLCPGGGTAPATLDDANNNGSWDAGEWVTAVLTDCLQDDGSVVKGSLGVSNFEITTSSVSFDARMTALEFKAVSGGSATYDGAFGYVSTTTDRITVAGSLAIDIVHPLYKDLVTLQDKYALVVTYPPGQTTLQANGNISSEQAGGTVVLRTREDIVVDDSELYPHAGRFEALGKKGSVTVTALPTSQAQIDFDQGDGAPYEDTTVVNWDFFLF